MINNWKMILLQVQSIKSGYFYLLRMYYLPGNKHTFTVIHKAGRYSYPLPADEEIATCECQGLYVRSYIHYIETLSHETKP